MESRKLEIVLHYAKDLHDRKHFGTMDPYATVWFAGGGMISEIHKTSVAKKAGSCPVWECPIEFEVVPKKNDYVLFCEIHHDGKLFDRKIGEVQVPFTDLLAGDGSGEKVSYPVKIQSGEVMGLIAISHKFSSTPEAKNEDNNTGTSGGKVKSNKKNDKEHTPTKKVKGKKKRGMVKRIAKSVGKKVVTEAVLLVGTAVALFVLEDDLEVEEEVEDEDGDEDEVDDEYVEVDDEYVDE